MGKFVSPTDKRARKALFAPDRFVDDQVVPMKTAALGK